MSKIKKFRTLEEGLLILRQEAQIKSLSIAEILRILSGKGRPLSLILLALPFCQPIQIPGMSIPFGLAIAFIGLRMAFGKRIWLPEKILSKTMPSKILEKIIDKTIFLRNKIKPWIHPRLIWLCKSSFMEKGNGLVICILGMLLALPLPIPLSNLAAAWSIFLLALGIIEDDGIFVFIGYILFILTIIFFLVMILAVKSIF